MKLDDTERFIINSTDPSKPIPIYNSDRSYDKELISNTAIPTDMTVVELSETNFPLVKIEYTLDGKHLTGWTVLDFSNLTGDSYICNLETKSYVDTIKAEDLYSELLKKISQVAPADQITDVNGSQSYQAYSTGATASTDWKARDADGDIIVTPDSTGSQQLSTTVNTELESVIRSYGVPPQWTKHVDPRTVSCKFTGQYTIDCRLGRRFVEVTLSNPTVIDIAPGYVYFNSKTLSEDSSMFDGDGNSNALWDAIKNNHGSLFTIKPCFGSFSYGSGSGKKIIHGYMAYVNALMRIAAVYMSRRALNTSDGTYKYYSREDSSLSLGNYPELKERPMPFFNTIYRKFNWEAYDEQNWLIIGDTKYAYSSPNEDKFQYIRFFSIEGTQSTDEFNTDVGETTIESSINGMLSGTLKDAAFLMGGIIGGSMGTTFDAVQGSIEQAINGFTGPGAGTISSLMHSVSAFATGGKLVFPQVITDCTYGKSMTVKCTFPAIYGDAEANYLNTMAPFIHILAFCLPHQVHTSMDMYTYPFLVKAYSKGIFSCDMGVLTGLNVNRGGEDGELWSYDSNATEISVSFEIRPLISKLIMSSAIDGPGWVLRNRGLQEYLGGLCGVDLRNNKIEMAKELFATLFQGKASAWYDNILNSLIANTFIGDIVNWYNMFDHYVNNDNSSGNTETDTSTYTDNGDSYTGLDSDSWFNSNTL